MAASDCIIEDCDRSSVAGEVYCPGHLSAFGNNGTAITPPVQEPTLEAELTRKWEAERASRLAEERAGKIATLVRRFVEEQGMGDDAAFALATSMVDHPAASVTAPLPTMKVVEAGPARRHMEAWRDLDYITACLRGDHGRKRQHIADTMIEALARALHW